VKIVVVLFPRFTALDAIGPYEVLQRLPGAELSFAGLETGLYRTERDRLGIVADVKLSDVPSPDVIVVPGGIGTRRLVGNPELGAWLRTAHATSRYTTSVCTGSLLLAGAGLLDGVDATTHWAARDTLRELGANPVPDRVVERGKIITAAGVSSGIDMALRLAALLCDETTAKALQLGIEYDPQPPYDCGAPEKAGPEVMERARQILQQDMR
jgi:putative intracellular protease/amidase